MKLLLTLVTLLLASAVCRAQCVTPQVTSLSPGSGPIAGSLPFTIVGTGFCSGLTVDFGSQPTQVTSVTVTQITGLIPPNPPGLTAVTITNPGADPLTLPNFFNYINAPAGFTASAGSAKFGATGQRLTFFGYVAGGVPPYSFYWNFKDGGTASTITGQHTYVNPGNYIVTFVVYDSAGSMALSETSAYVTRPVTNFLTDDKGNVLTDGQGNRLLAR